MPETPARHCREAQAEEGEGEEEEEEVIILAEEALGMSRDEDKPCHVGLKFMMEIECCCHLISKSYNKFIFTVISSSNINF
jgi:hypothetical protein